MHAFIKTERGLFKVYRHGGDWQIVGPDFERWFSVWTRDERGSLQRAIDSAPGSVRTVQIIAI